MSDERSPYRHRLTVRFRDCDAMGHVNHAVFFTFLEQCRLTCWRELTGAPTPYARVIVARAECDYRAPAHFGDELEIRMAVGDVGNSSFSLVYQVDHAGTGRRLADARTVMVTYDYAAGRPVAIPLQARQLLERMQAPPARPADGV